MSDEATLERLEVIQRSIGNKLINDQTLGERELLRYLAHIVNALVDIYHERATEE